MQKTGVVIISMMIVCGTFVAEALRRPPGEQGDELEERQLTFVQRLMINAISNRVKVIAREEFETQLGIVVDFDWEELTATYDTIVARIKDEVDIDEDQVKAFFASKLNGATKREVELLETLLRDLAESAVITQIKGIIKEEFKSQLGIEVDFTMDELKATMDSIATRVKDEFSTVMDMDVVKNYLASKMKSE